MSSWTPSNPSAPPGGANAHYDVATLDHYQKRFRNMWMGAYVIHLELGDDWGSFGSGAVNVLLKFLLIPALQPMSNDHRRNYQLYLPRSVWLDLPRDSGTGFKFTLLAKHFELIMDMYLDGPAETSISWVRINYYRTLLMWLVHGNHLTSDTWVGLMQDTTTALLLPYVPENYVSNLERAGSWLKEQVLIQNGFTLGTGFNLVMKCNQFIMHEDYVTMEPDPEPAQPDPLPTMGHDEAVDYVNGLDQVSMSDHPSATEKCPFCWGLFNGSDADPEDTNDLTVCQTPCNHLYHKGCLI